MSKGRTIRVLAAAGLTLSFVFIAHAEEVRQPMVAPPSSTTTPAPCFRYSKIVLNHVFDTQGNYRASYWLFYTHWYLDGKHYWIISDWKSANGEKISHNNQWPRMWKLEMNGYCVEAGQYEETSTPYDIEVVSREYKAWFESTYPKHGLPKIGPTPTPLVGV